MTRQAIRKTRGVVAEILFRHFLNLPQPPVLGAGGAFFEVSPPLFAVVVVAVEEAFTAPQAEVFGFETLP